MFMCNCSVVYVLFSSLVANRSALFCILCKVCISVLEMELSEYAGYVSIGSTNYFMR